MQILFQGLTWDGVKIHVEPHTDYMLDMIAAQMVSFKSYLPSGNFTHNLFD
jgi:hypothetical protein